jgi:glycosyltransferase involved in cell wall biosynthesis
MRLARLMGISYSVTAHAYDIYEKPRNIREKLDRSAFATSGCDYTVRHLRGLVGPGARAKVHRIVMGVDGERLQRRSPYPGGRRILAVGRLVEKKGFEYLIEAVALMRTPPELVRIVGDGPLRADLARRIRELGLDALIELDGWREPDAVRLEMEAADLLAMPCVVAASGDRDSMPVVVKEALAMEVPVVATDEVGLPELVRPLWGRLVAPRDAEALAMAIEDVLALPAAERHAMGKAGRAFVLEHCDVRSETRKLARLVAATVSAASEHQPTMARSGPGDGRHLDQVV